MPRDLAQLFRQENHKAEQTSILHTLISVETPVPSTLYITDANYDISFGGNTYSKFPCKMSDISISASGSIDKATFTVANPSRTFMPYLEQYKGLRNQTVRVKKVYAKFLPYIYTMSETGTVTTTVNPDSDPTAYLEDVYSIDSYVADENTITFQLDPRADFNVMLTRRRYTQNSCYWMYKDATTCAYISNTTGSITSGSNQLTVLDATGLLVGKYITISGVNGSKKITGVTGNVLTLDSPANTNRTNAAVSLTLCDKTLNDCAAHKNKARIGCFAGINGNRRIQI